MLRPQLRTRLPHPWDGARASGPARRACADEVADGHAFLRREPGATAPVLTGYRSAGRVSLARVHSCKTEGC